MSSETKEQERKRCLCGSYGTCVGQRELLRGWQCGRDVDLLELDELRGELTALSSALKEIERYVEHKDDCAMLPRDVSGPGWYGQTMPSADAKCTCGLADSLAILQRREQEQTKA